MTKSEFLEKIDDTYELIEFCNENGLEDMVEDIVDDDEKDDRIDEWISNEIHNSRWYDIYRILEDVPTGYSYYRYESESNIESFDDYDFQNLRDQVLERCIDEEIIVDDDEDEDEDYWDGFDDEEEFDEEAEEEAEAASIRLEFGEPDSEDDFSSFINDSLSTQNALPEKQETPVWLF